MNASINLHGITKITIERSHSEMDADCDPFNLTSLVFTDSDDNDTRIAVFSDEFVDIEELIEINAPEPQHLKMKDETVIATDFIPDSEIGFLNDQNS